MRTMSIIFSIIAASTIPSLAYTNSIITTAQLIEEIADLQQLTEFPNNDYKLLQFSSYDRRSVQRLHSDWFSNSDGFGSEPIPGFMSVLKEEKDGENGEYLLAKVDGPGTIVRFWTAAIKGNLKVYLDNEEMPIYEGPAESFFRSPYNPFIEGTKITEELLKGSLYQRDAAYCPMPFSRLCKIVWIGKIQDIHFYHLMVRVYKEGTIVQTFSPNDLKVAEEQIVKICNILKKPETLWAEEQSQKITIENELPPKQEVAIWSNKTGPGAVINLKLRVKDYMPTLTLRELILRIYADGIQEPLVDSPLIDFFSAAPGINPYQSLPMEITPDGWLVSRFPMPYQKDMTITLRNITDRNLYIEGEVLSQPYEWESDSSMYFCARWRSSQSIWVRPEHPYDLPFLYAKGKGCIVGAVSHVFNPSTGPTSGGNWWGEGDEKIFVDQDKVPSIFGTGSEDFYNYSWSATDIFYYPYCGQPRNDGPGNRGFVSNFRWLILDRIPFNEYVAFSLELLIHSEVYDMEYARIAYYYARPETTDDHSPIADRVYDPLSARDNWHWLPEPKGAANNAIFYQAEDCLNTKTQTELLKSYMWAGRGLCVWKPKRGGEIITFKIQVPRDGNYDVKLICALSPQSGNFHVLFDEKLITTSPISLYDEFHVLSREFNLGKQQITSGEHTLTLKFIGAESKDIGIDFIWLQPI